jgi:hypothetical protein
VRVAARNEAGRGEWSELSATPIIPALTSMQYNASSLHAGDTFSLRLSFMYAPSHTCNLSCRAIFDIECAILLVVNANVASRRISTALEVDDKISVVLPAGFSVATATLPSAPLRFRASADASLQNPGGTSSIFAAGAHPCG